MIYMIILAHEIEIRIPDSIISFSSECRIPICNISFRRNAFASANPSQLASFIEKKDLQNIIFLFLSSSTKRSEIADPRSRQVSLRLQDWSRSWRFGKGEKTEFLSTYENDAPNKYIFGSKKW